MHCYQPFGAAAQVIIIFPEMETVGSSLRRPSARLEVTSNSSRLNCNEGSELYSVPSHPTSCFSKASWPTACPFSLRLLYEKLEVIDPKKALQWPKNPSPLRDTERDSDRESQTQRHTFTDTCRNKNHKHCETQLTPPQ